MKRLLIGLLLALALVQTAVAQSGSLWLGVGADTDIVDCGVTAPTTAVVGEQFSVDAWLTVRNSGIAGAGWNTDMLGSVFAQVQSKATLTISREEGWGVPDTVSAVGKQFAANGRTGYDVTVITRLDGTITVRVTYSGLATQTNARGMVSGLSEIQALALVTWPGCMAWGKAWDSDAFAAEWFVKSMKPVSHRTSEPVAEHVVFHLPADTWWAELWLIEDDGRMTTVPALQPANQLPNVVHADLMVGGDHNRDYVIRPCRADGSCYAAMRFTVNWSGSVRTTEVWYGD